MKYFTQIWSWIKDNLPFIFIVVIFGIYVWASAATLQATAQHDEDELACKILCFPQQSEYIIKGELSSCWCYLDNNTIKRSQQ